MDSPSLAGSSFCCLVLGLGYSGGTRPRPVMRLGACAAGQFFGLISGDQLVDKFVKLAVHHARQVIACQVDAVVGDAVLRKVIGADFLGAFACADLSPALV